MSIRRLALACTAASAVLAALASAPAALANGDHVGRTAHPGHPGHHRPEPRLASDHLTITVTKSGRPSADGTRELYCHPGGGDHPHTTAACAKLDKATIWGKDPFAPVPRGTRCTLQYGGPATAHISGHWAGRPVEADFSRDNGCETHRWDELVPMLPRTGL
jgi:hypothetical protein